MKYMNHQQRSRKISKDKVQRVPYTFKKFNKYRKYLGDGIDNPLSYTPEEMVDISWIEEQIREEEIIKNITDVEKEDEEYSTGTSE